MQRTGWWTILGIGLAGAMVVPVTLMVRANYATRSRMVGTWYEFTPPARGHPGLVRVMRVRADGSFSDEVCRFAETAGAGAPGARGWAWLGGSRTLSGNWAVDRDRFFRYWHPPSSFLDRCLVFLRTMRWPPAPPADEWIVHAASATELIVGGTPGGTKARLVRVPDTFSLPAEPRSLEQVEAAGGPARGE